MVHDVHGKLNPGLPWQTNKWSIFTKKFDFHLRKKLAKRYIYSIDLRGAEIWTFWKVDQKCLESFKIWCWRTMGKICGQIV
jgi:hypothetical protein